jgi:hypothetical protein
MKNKLNTITSAFIALCILFNVSQVKAQKEKGQSVITAGVGYSLVGIIGTAFADAIKSNTTVKMKNIPVIMGAYDFGISEKFSVGLSYTYQSLSAEYDNYVKDTITYYGNFKDKITRQNIGIRPLFHFGDNEDLDTYFGARLSYTLWNYTTTTNNTIEDFDDLFVGRPRFQALVGARYFFTDLIGFNFELAIGPSYFGLFGLNVKF